ncbi:hypothetical protein BHAOGJBA_5159 [Methylobacterium hispanicum]|uniref:DUF4268 domain-containing protein n=1 Tax=Methylobacterium hispanicum TaxID=270350 RepID=A0AAV4ZSQ0_9HYPH|nr:hypothetical protein [Methylobacterium hispanicum]GJD91611.1 hypothetical protein BHAOGJBA_5159 [Methylobacterium hispanicum]
MYGRHLVFEHSDGSVRRARRLALGDTSGRDEAWLRDFLFAHPETLPVVDVDPSYERLIPLCRELGTEAGPLDIVYLDDRGRLVMVECKLWRNPESRRKVVAQILDYARAISTWSYSDLQRRVSAATRRKGNVPFEIARAVSPDLEEHVFVDRVTASMRSGRFLLLIAGDGIREDVSAMAELINRNAALGFSFGLVEVALYGFGDAEAGIVVQPRVVARTQIIERSVVLLQDAAPGTRLAAVPDEGGAPSEDAGIAAGPIEGEAQVARRASPPMDEYRRWWQPILEMRFDDPDQAPPVLYSNNVRMGLPLPATWITAYGDARDVGVFFSGRGEAHRRGMELLLGQEAEILSELPEGSVHDTSFRTVRRQASFAGDDEKRAWLAATANAYVNALRPRLRSAVKL